MDDILSEFDLRCSCGKELKAVVSGQVIVVTPCEDCVACNACEERLRAAAYFLENYNNPTVAIPRKPVITDPYSDY